MTFCPGTGQHDRSLRLFCLVCLAVIVCAAAVCSAARADLLTGDPRKCSVSTPGGPSHHAAECAKAAAVATTRATMARHESVDRWYSPVYCNTLSGNLLRWKCLSFQGGTHWTITVWFRTFASGWKRQVTVTSSP